MSMLAVHAQGKGIVGVALPLPPTQRWIRRPLAPDVQGVGADGGRSFERVGGVRTGLRTQGDGSVGGGAAGRGGYGTGGGGGVVEAHGDWRATRGRDRGKRTGGRIGAG